MCRFIALIAFGWSPLVGALEVPPVTVESIVFTSKEAQKPGSADIVSLQAAFRAQRGTDAALGLAQDLVARTRDVFGVSHGNYARALTNLATVQAERGLFDAAAENYIAAIRAHERASRSISSNDLINPLHGLASTYLALDEAPRARAFLLRAQNIIERAIPGFMRAQDVGTAVPETIALSDAARQTPAGAVLASAQSAFEMSYQADPERAVGIAKELVALTSDGFGESPDYTARALTNLAIAQVAVGDYRAAMTNFTTAIRTHERHTRSIVSDRLINPLLGLADASLLAGDTTGAIAAFERALHVSHVNEGPNNPKQVAIVDALRRAYFLAGDHEAANKMGELGRQLFERRRDDRPGQQLDALEQHAAWLARAGDFDAATRAYDKLVRAMSDRHGERDARLIEPLVAFAESTIRSRRLNDLALSRRLPPQMLAMTVYSEVRRTLTDAPSGEDPSKVGVDEAALLEGLGAMARAVQVARDRAQADPATLARTLVKQGDWLASLNQADLSLGPYREAWALLDDDPALHLVRDQLFARPAPVTRVALRPIYVSRSGSADTPARYTQRGYAELAFDVDAEGRPRNVRVVAAEPAGLMDSHLAQQLRRFRFRPAFSDGEPRRVEGLIYRHAFYYDASRLTYGERQIIAATSYDDAARPPYSSPSDASRSETPSSSSGTRISSP